MVGNKKKCNNLTVLIMAGGTGGHIFPGLATAKELQKIGYKIHWIGTKNSMESEIVPKYGIDISYISVSGLRGKGWLSLVKAPWLLTHSFFQAKAIIKKHNPVCVLGMGGYVSGSGGLAAFFSRIPLVIHEQNAVVGLTNKILSKLATRVLEGFPNTFKKQSIANKKIIYTGNPIRQDLEKKVEILKHTNKKQLRLLVIGGSRGADILNQLTPEALKLLGVFDPSIFIEVWHQTGKNNLHHMQEKYTKLGINARVDEFIDDMYLAYDWCNLVLCRSGALTICELAAVGRASILVPYPYAVDDHQAVNANFLTSQQAAVMIRESSLTANLLSSTILSCFKKTEDMSVCAKLLSVKNAAKRVAEVCAEVAYVR